MELTRDLVLVFFLAIAIFNGLGLIVILNVPPRRSAANHLLGLLLLFNIFPFIEFNFSFFRMQLAAETFEFLTLPFANGPLYWLYLLYASGLRKSFKSSDLKHFIPMAFILLLSLLSGITGVDTHQSDENLLLDLLGTASEDLFNLSYLIAGGMQIKRMRKDSRKVSACDSLLLHWLQLLFLMVCAIPLYSLFELLCIVQNIHIPVLVDRISILFETLLIQFTALYIFIRPDRTSELQRLTSSEREISREDKKYGSSQLRDSILEEYSLRLERLLEEETPYLESELNIGNLAERIGISIHQLSQLINSRYKTNFYGLMNGLRTEEAKRLLRNSDLTVIDVSYEAGFNSKSTFNRVFKELTGKTPSQFRKGTEREECAK